MEFRSVAFALFIAVAFAEPGIASEVTRKDAAQDSIIQRLESLEAELASVKSRNDHLEAAVDELNTLNEQVLADTELLKEKSEQLEKRLEYFEILSRKILPRTCHELRNLGMNKSGQYLIDPDGLGIGNDPIEAYCDMGDSSGSTTLVDVPSENSVAIDNQIKALIQMSEECTGLEQGSLTCSGHKDMKVFESCESLWIAGHTAPGYYILDGPQGLNYRLAKCNLDLQPIDSEFEIPTQVMLAEFPVAFDFYRTENSASVQFPHSHLNDGNAMTPEGIFTVPLDGVYAFSLYALQCGSGSPMETVLQILVDGNVVAASFARARPHEGSSVGDNLSISVQTIVPLTQGQEVSLGPDFQTTDTLCFVDYAHSHFTGALLHPL